MTTTPGDDRTPPGYLCSQCGADRMGCDVKLGLGGRKCRDDCEHRKGTRPHQAEDDT